MAKLKPNTTQAEIIKKKSIKRRIDDGIYYANFIFTLIILGLFISDRFLF